jgi:hypothetical protein
MHPNHELVATGEVAGENQGKARIMVAVVNDKEVQPYKIFFLT